MGVKENDERTILVLLILFFILDQAFCFSCARYYLSISKNSLKANTDQYQCLRCKNSNSGEEKDDSSFGLPKTTVPTRFSWNKNLRRDFLQQIINFNTLCSTSIKASSLSFLSISPAWTSGTPSLAVSQVEGDKYIAQVMSSFYDIPAKSPNCFRLYLVRHGETENNRLHLVQGARVDSSLNDTGKKQAKRLGQALSMLHGNQNDGNLLFVHSSLKRSKETAHIAASTYLEQKITTRTYYNTAGDDEQQRVTNLGVVGLGHSTPPIMHSKKLNDSGNITLQVLPSIGEIDFGLQEGKPSSSVRSEMFQTYSSWSVGLIDAKSADGSGETGRQVCSVCVWKKAILRHALIAIGSLYSILQA
jgi:broad specificity phosphatase PhoE